ncbi:MAG: MotA/TolQ/ExbB proton channel family protein [Planctomycetota bacterium]|nr:MotA/TolQ/ExbB proton channel family protein [Planctomycetota bacterium]
MIELFWVGGPFFMLPLLLGSVLVVTIAIERARRFRRVEINYDGFLSEMRETVRDDGISAGIELAEETPGPIAAAWTAGLQHHRVPLPILREKMDSVSIAEIQRLERFLPLVSVIAQVAPLIGILGTVWGMIGSFEGVAGGLARGSGVDGELLASGIGQALVTTALGLAVAIPATLLHHWFSHRVDRFIDDLERSRSDLIELLTTVVGRKKARPVAAVPEKQIG